jgi:YbbR domain-containing protein
MKWPAVIIGLLFAVVFFLTLAAQSDAATFMWPVEAGKGGESNEHNQ